MVHRFRERFRTPAGAQIQPVNAEPGFKGRLRKTSNIPGISRTLQAMKENDLRFCCGLRLMFQDYNRDLVRDPVDAPDRRKPILVQTPLPEISGDR
jgi:hypothetical protein